MAMDLTGLGMYTDYMTDVNRVNTENLQKKLENTAQTEEKEDAALFDACKQFEAYFVEQMFKEMWKTVPETEYSFQSTGTMVDLYKDNMIQEMASMTTETGGLGLAQTLYEQMKITNGL